MVGPKQKTKDRALTETKLLDAAEEVFSLMGFQGATTRLIANKAGVNLALINRYFDGKYGLLISIMERKSDFLTDIDQHYPAQEGLVEELVVYSDFFFAGISENISLFKIINGQFASDQKFLKTFRSRFPLCGKSKHLIIRIEKLIKKKKYKMALSPENVVMIIENFVFSYINAHVLIHDRPIKEVRKDLKETITVFAKGLIAH